MDNLIFGEYGLANRSICGINGKKASNAEKLKINV